MSLITDLIAEIEAAQVRSAPAWEGFRDLQRVLTDADGSPARDLVNKAVAEYGQRDALSRQALMGLKALLSDGYPTDKKFVTDGPILQTITEQLQTVTAAIGTLSTPGEAVTADVEIGKPVVR